MTLGHQASRIVRRRTAGVLAGVLCAAGAAILTTPALAADFSGKRITILVPFNEGGGTDSYTRFLSPFFQKHLPGNPKILVLNKSGAGGILGGNYFEQKAKKGRHLGFRPVDIHAFEFRVERPASQIQARSIHPDHPVAARRHAVRP